MEDDTLDLTDFVEELRLLCNEYGVTLSGCNCGGLIINFTHLPIEEFEIDFPDEDIHIEPKFAEMVKAA